MHFIKRIRTYLYLRPSLADEQEIVEEISRGVSFRGANLWVLIFAIFIASLGLNVNSTAVIIGAMLISPLMGPILGMGLAIGINDLDLLKRAVKNFSIATLISVLTAMLYFILSPLEEAQSELLARTSPTVYDILIAFFGGAAGITALAVRGRAGNVLPGVAIATALMPPLCTAGFGLATGNLLFFLGAFYLFFINTVFISLSTYLGVRLMGFHQHQFLTPERAKKAKHILTWIVILATAPALVMTVNILRDGYVRSNLQRFVRTELNQSGTQILSSELDEELKTVSVVAVGRDIDQQKQAEATKRLADYGLADYALTVIQGGQSDSLLLLQGQLEQRQHSQATEHQKFLELSAEHAAVTQRLAEYSLYEEFTRELAPEVHSLFPTVRTLSLAPVTEARVDTTATKRYVAVLVGTDSGKALRAEEQGRLHRWMQARVKADSLLIIYAPQR